MSHLPTLEDLGDLEGKNVLVRADFNVPLSDAEIRDELRIKEALPTLKFLVKNGANGRFFPSLCSLVFWFVFGQFLAPFWLQK